jgi:hypothetical protein
MLSGISDDLSFFVTCGVGEKRTHGPFLPCKPGRMCGFAASMQTRADAWGRRCAVCAVERIDQTRADAWSRRCAVCAVERIDQTRAGAWGRRCAICAVERIDQTRADAWSRRCAVCAVERIDQTRAGAWGRRCAICAVERIDQTRAGAWGRPSLPSACALHCSHTLANGFVAQSATRTRATLQQCPRISCSFRIRARFAILY